jgi:hypothetical protein
MKKPLLLLATVALVTVYIIFVSIPSLMYLHEMQQRHEAYVSTFVYWLVSTEYYLLAGAPLLLILGIWLNRRHDRGLRVPARW